MANSCAGYRCPRDSTRHGRARLRLGVLDVAIPVYAQADSRDVPIDSDEFEGAT